ncbi:hypothetical protein MAR_008940 [Mya arenaria]|uniref:Uncharacterized protein n=1 Tax=Mya arenaria TaxID=6604 RepID=A0ABY7E0M7_MYAAR|nr:hypothetical protein MAR_008940 [Mya arenaria]
MDFSVNGGTEPKSDIQQVDIMTSSVCLIYFLIVKYNGKVTEIVVNYVHIQLIYIYTQDNIIIHLIFVMIKIFSKSVDNI